MSVSNLSVLASLREIAAIKGRKEFFTLRREVAKDGGTSKQQRSVGLSSRASISVSNLSGFASLRETSVTQGRKEFFTLRRQVAKDGGTSKQQRSVGLSSRASISVSNLSGLASLREIAAIKGREEVFHAKARSRKGRRKAVGEDFEGGALKPWQP
jgi:hypothetical protein